MIDPASSWFEIVELRVITEAIPLDTKGRKGKKTHEESKLAYFNKSSAMISNFVNKTWFSWYPRCQYINYDNGSKFWPKPIVGYKNNKYFLGTLMVVKILFL